MSGDVVVAGWVGSTNLGDELVHAGLRRLLARVGVDDPVVVSQDPEATTATFGGRAVAPAAGLRAIAGARLLAWGGGGIVQDETSSLNLPYHLARPAAAAAAGVPWVGIGLGVGPLVGATAPAQVRLLRRAVGLTVRDPASAALLRDTGVPGATVACDLALALDPPEVAVEDVLVASLRPWEASVTGAARLLPVSARTALRTGAWARPWWPRRDGGPGAPASGRDHGPVPVPSRRDRPRGSGPSTPAAHAAALPDAPAPDADEDRLRQHAAALDAAATATGLRVRLVALQTDDDAALLTAVADRMRADVEVVVPDVHTVVPTIAAGRVVVAMRYHAGIAATLGGRPVVALSYSPKVTALADALGTGARRLSWDAAPDAVAGAAADLLADIDAPATVAAARDRLRTRLGLHEELLEAGLAAGADR